VRVVSLTCSNTEIVCALGCADSLVGVDDHSDFPEEVVRALPRVGPDLGVDAERVKALEPDLVLASLTVPGHERVVESIARAGLHHLAPEPTSLADVRADVLLIGAALGVPERASALAAELDDAFRPTPVEGERPRVMVEWWPKPVIVPGRRSWVTELIELAGGVNPLGERDVKSAPLSDDEAARLAPDAVVISWCGAFLPCSATRSTRCRRPSWGGLAHACSRGSPPCARSCAPYVAPEPEAPRHVAVSERDGRAVSASI
jgi:iron complex transport system substrate-binding protein